MTQELFFGPASLKQQLVLLEDSVDILLTGGGAGSGKSRMCLTKAIKYIEDPAARVMIIRQSYPTLKLSGGLVDESKNIFPHFGGVYKVQAMKWVFPNGATIQFGAIPADLREWQGLQATHMLVDEAAEFTEEQILFLLSRLRSAQFKGHMCMLLTCNPDSKSFLMKGWVDWCLDPETGIPNPGTENVTRYFVNLNGKMYWGESPEVLYAAHGAGKKLGEDFICKSFKFIPMTIYDNPILLKNNPEYLASLLAQPRVNQQRFLYGSWTARPENSTMFSRDWVQIVDFPPVNPVAKVRSYDLAGSVPSESNPNPDFTVGVLMSRDKLGNYYIEHVTRYQKLTDGVIKSIIEQAKYDGEEIIVTIPRDAGAGGKIANTYLTRVLSEAGLTVKSVVMSGHSSKGQRFLPFCSLAEGGSVKVVRGEWNDDYLTELEHFEPGSRKGHDDCPDATSDAFNFLCRQIMNLPTFSLPEMTQQSPIPKI
jgi:predicted phage terminase large subunit-like protein